MTTHQRRILDAAVAALKKTTGINASVHHDAAGQHSETETMIELEMGRRKHRFTVAVKTVDRFATPAMLMARREALRKPRLLVAPYISQQVAERCRQLRLSFIDTAGNAYLEAPGSFVCVVGQARPAELRKDNFGALNPSGLKLIFAMLCRPKLLNENYRAIATAAGVALGTVSADMKDLETRGYFNLETHPSLRKPLDQKRMLEEWVLHYPITLRPRLSLGRFRADPALLQKTDLAPLNAYWGGEPAAEKLTRYLKPAHFTIYSAEPIAKLIAAGRMRAEADGNVEILEKFWSFPPDPTEVNDMPDVVPPILAYADLLATHDSRNAETARMIYEQRIAPAFRTAE